MFQEDGRTVSREKALIIPSTQADRSKRRKFIEKVKKYMKARRKERSLPEERR